MVSGASLSQLIHVLMILSTSLELNHSLNIQVPTRVGTYCYFHPSVYFLFASSQLFHVLTASFFPLFFTSKFINQSKALKTIGIGSKTKNNIYIKLILGSKGNLMNSIEIFGGRF